MRAAVLLPILPMLLVCAAGGAHAQASQKFQRECAEWVAKKGYSVDYIEQRVGTRPSGNSASDWVANLDPKDVQPNDVVFMYIQSAGGKAQRAEVVDEVLRHPDGSIRALRTSSMNSGPMVEPVCHVTENFGKVTTHRVAFDRVIRAWRARP
jgi:hypothetical protein